LADRIAKNARRFLGTQQRDIQLEKSLQQQLDETSGNLESFLAQNSRSPSAVAEWNETTLSLAQAIESLPDDYQQVVILRNLQGKSFREVADAMNRSIDSVEKLWIRALVKLKQSMNG
jgi:RNA polymerase sigma-70 factor (ECF subfamily)